jgi:hypothetical protein
MVRVLYYLDANGIEEEIRNFPATAVPVYAANQFGPTGFSQAGEITINLNGDYDFTATNNWNGILVLQYKSGDNVGNNSERADLTITVNAANDVTVTTDDLVPNANEGQQNVSGNVLDNDFDHDTVGAYNASPSALKVQTFSYLDIAGVAQTYTAGATAVDVYVLGHDGVTFVKAGSLAMSEDGDYAFNASADYNGQVTVTYSVKDTVVDSVAVEANLTIQLAQVDDQPTASTDNGTTLAEAGTYTGNLLTGSLDPDTDAALNVTATTLRVTVVLF